MTARGPLEPKRGDKAVASLIVHGRGWQARASQEELTMSAESVSVVKVHDVLMVTVPADPDDATVATLQEKALAGIERYGAKGLVLDISAVDTLDSYFARLLAETAQMVAIMGGRTVVAGMRAGVAITATQLGLTLGGAQTALNVDQALDLLGQQHRNDRSHANGRKPK